MTSVRTWRSATLPVRSPASSAGAPRVCVLTGAVFALLSALGYGISDFVGGPGVTGVWRRLRVVLVSYRSRVVLLAGLAVVVGGQVSQGAVFLGRLVQASSQALGVVWWFYAAPRSGPISVVSPLTAILVARDPGRCWPGDGGAARRHCGHRRGAGSDRGGARQPRSHR